MGELVQDSQVLYWRGDDDDLNFGDALSELLRDRALIGPRIRASRYRLIGSVIDARNIGVDLADIHDGGVVAYWGCGARDEARPPRDLLERCEFYGVRGPLTRDLIGLPPDTPIGDTGLLAPLLRPAPRQRRGEAICIPHYYEPRSDDELIAVTGADRVLRPNIPAAAEAERVLDEIAGAGFVLAGALHGAIVAHAYGVPFAFFDAGHLDIAFKWRDFAASIEIATVFVRTVADGRRAYAEFIEGRARRLPLSDILAASPYYVRPSILLAAAEHDGLASVPARLRRVVQSLPAETPAYAAAVADSQRRHDGRLNARFSEVLAQLAEARQTAAALGAEAAVAEDARAAADRRLAELGPLAAQAAALQPLQAALELDNARLEGRLDEREAQMAFERDAVGREIGALERELAEAQAVRRAAETDLAGAHALAAERLAEARAQRLDTEADLAGVHALAAERLADLQLSEAALAEARAQALDTEAELAGAQALAAERLADLQLGAAALVEGEAALALSAAMLAESQQAGAVAEERHAATLKEQREALALDNARLEARRDNADRQAALERDALGREITALEDDLTRARALSAERLAELEATAGELEFARPALAEARRALEAARRAALEAAADARLVLRVGRAPAPLALALARLAARRRDWPVAERGYAAVLRAHPDDASARVQYGHALKEQGELGLAAVAYSRAWASPFAPPDVAQHLAHALRASGQFGEAGRLDAELRRRDASNEPATTLPRTPAAIAPWRAPTLWAARLAARRGQWTRAARRYQQLLRRAPGGVNLWVQYGHALKESGQPRAARAAYLAALDLDPERADTHLQLGHLMKITGRLDEAGQAYGRAAALDPNLADARRELAALTPATPTVRETQPAAPPEPDPADAFAQRHGLTDREARLLEALHAAASPAAE